MFQYTPIEDFLQGKTVLNTNATNFQEGIQALITSGADIVTYRVRREFLVNSIPAFECVGDNKLKYEITLHDGDIITDVESHLPIVITVAQAQATPSDLIVVIAAQYSTIKVTFYLNREMIPETFTLTYKVMLLEHLLRDDIARAKGIRSGSLIYANGLAVLAP